MSNSYQFYTPFPPTVNSYYSHTKRGVYISAKGRAFRATLAESLCKQIIVDSPIVHRIILTVVLYPPDRRKRDLDNYMKALLDAITHYELWEDDSLIDQLIIYRGVVLPRTGGKVFVSVDEAGPLIPNCDDPASIIA